MHLDLRKLLYGRNPWRLGQVDDTGVFHAIPRAWFRTRREGVPWRQRFLGAADWSMPLDTWTPDERAHVEAIMEALPATLELARLTADHPMGWR